MSESIIVCLPTDSLPTIDQLRGGVGALGLNLDSWNETTLSAIEGFWPAKYNTEDAGCEFSCYDTDYEWLDEMQLNDSLLSDRQMTCELSFFGDPSDLASAAIIAHYLCEKCSGAVFSEDDEAFFVGEAATQWAKQIQKEADEMILNID